MKPDLRFHGIGLRERVLEDDAKARHRRAYCSDCRHD